VLRNLVWDALIQEGNRRDLHRSEKGTAGKGAIKYATRERIWSTKRVSDVGACGRPITGHQGNLKKGRKGISLTKRGKRKGGPCEKGAAQTNKRNQTRPYATRLTQEPRNVKT